MGLEEFKEKLKRYKREEIIFSYHARLRAEFREVNLEEIQGNILNPEKLVYFREVSAEKKNEKKYECYFAYNENLCHKYVLVLNGKVIIVTIIVINRRWQSMLRK